MISFQTMFGTNSPTTQHDSASVGNCSPLLLPDVGEIRQHSVEQELDDVIRELGEKAVQAMKDGDPTGARILTSRMYAAIASRTPEHQARLTAEVNARIDDELTFGGEWTRDIA